MNATRQFPTLTNCNDTTGEDTYELSGKYSNDEYYRRIIEFDSI